jgi:hypothetical protein
MSFTVQKWDNNTTEIVYKLYAFDSDFIIQKEVLVGNLLESTYYNSNVSIETIAAAWTTRASKTYDYKLKENLVDNRFNRNFLALQDSYSCSLFESARKGINIKVEDFPLLWIEGNGGSGYYDTYKGDTFVISGNGCVYGGSVADYNAVMSIIIEEKSIETDFTSKLFDKFNNLNYLDLDSNNVSVVNVSNVENLRFLKLAANPISALDITNNLLLDDIHFGDCPNLDYINISNNTLLTSVRLQTQTESNFLLNLADLVSHNQNNGLLVYELDKNITYFDGLTQGITLDSLISLNSDFTIEASVFIIQNGHLFSDSSSGSRIMSSSNNIRIDSGTNNIILNANLNTNTVQFLKITRVGSTLNVYNDDVLISTGTWTFDVNIDVFAKKRGGATSVPPLGGYMKDVVINNNGTIDTYAMNEGSGTNIDNSTGSNDGTFDGSWGNLMTSKTGITNRNTLQSRGWNVVKENI